MLENSLMWRRLSAHPGGNDLGVLTSHSAERC